MAFARKCRHFFHIFQKLRRKVIDFIRISAGQFKTFFSKYSIYSSKTSLKPWIVATSHFILHITKKNFKYFWKLTEFYCRKKIFKFSFPMFMVRIKFKHANHGVFANFYLLYIHLKFQINHMKKWYISPFISLIISNWWNIFPSMTLTIKLIILVYDMCKGRARVRNI